MQYKFDKLRMRFVDEVVLWKLYFWKKIARAPKGPIGAISHIYYKAKDSPHMYMYYNHCLRVPNFTPFHPTITRFRNNWGLWFLHRLQSHKILHITNCEFEIFDTKCSKSKTQQPPILFCEGHWEEYSEQIGKTFWLWFLGGLAFCSYCFPCYRKR